MLEDGRVATEFESISNQDGGKCRFGRMYLEPELNERRMSIELELTEYLEEENADALINQFTVPADYDGIGYRGTKFVFYM